MLLETDLLAVDMPMSAKFPPEDERWKFGCAGRWTLWFIDIDRAWDAVNGAFRNSLLEETRFTAEAGCGIPEKFCMWPRVSRGRRTLKSPGGCDMASDYKPVGESVAFAINVVAKRVAKVHRGVREHSVEMRLNNNQRDLQPLPRRRNS